MEDQNIVKKAKKTKKQQDEEKAEYLKKVEEETQDDVLEDEMKLYMGDCIEKNEIIGR